MKTITELGISPAPWHVGDGVYTTPKAVLEIARKEATAAVYEIRHNSGAFLIEAMNGGVIWLETNTTGNL